MGLGPEPILIAALFAFALSAAAPRLERSGREDAARSIRVIDAFDSAPLSAARARIRSWYHSTLTTNRGRWVDPRCCRVDDESVMNADTRGVIPIDDRRFIRSVVTVRIEAPGHLPGEVLYQQGRLTALRIGETEIAGHALDLLVGPHGREPGRIDLALPRR